jgi:poly-gamma-glutamate capsule biosynthesis protein CapA/YwtB (metallophosphatase superfamily)
LCYTKESLMRHPIAALLLLALALLAPAAPALAQRPDGLDQPLLALNRCGPGGGETHFTLAATGDTFPHENIQAVGEAQGYDVLFDYVRPFLQAADLAYTNFDGAMLAGAGYTGYPNFNFNPALAPALRGAGIGLVSTANNHILDRGPEGLDATLGVLDASGILHHGAVRSDAAERPPFLPLTLSRDGASITIGFISATWGTNGIPDPFGQVNLLYESNSYGSQGGVRQGVLDAVAQAAAATDLVVVAAHWGFEYQFYPHTSQIEAARRLAEAGADIILGAQSHTLQPVEIIEYEGRKTLVIYSLANFLASQGAFQAQSYAATSFIFYVGLARAADGAVRVTGYRYLPTIHVDGDTRPAPIQPGTADDVIAHVRTIMRDPGGLHQVPATPPPAGRVEVCPPLLLAEAPSTPIPGDFAQHYATLGGLVPRSLNEAISVLGLPLGPPVIEPSGDCATPIPVLYTERQRLELHAGEPWPYRIVGTQLGTHAFIQRHPGRAAERRTELGDPATFADSRFRAFYEQYGGLAIFGYPISGALNEDHPETGVPTTVQYFERARFELAPAAPPGAPLSDQVRLGLLGRELREAGGAAALCGGPLAEAGGVGTPIAIAATPSPAAGLLPAVSDEDLALIGAAATQLAQSATPWIPYLAFAALAVTLLALLSFAFADWRGYRRRGARRGYRHRRSAYERFARVPTSDAEQAARIRAARPAPPPAPTSAPPSRTDADEDDLLRSLLDQQ